MKLNLSYILVYTLLSLVLINTAFADEKRAMMKPGDLDTPANIISKAASAYRALQNTAPGVPSSLLNKARCVVVVPQAITAAVVLGGTHGDGIASCKVKNEWSGPTFVDLNGASFGIQIGGKQSDIILFLTSDAAVDSLKNGKLTFGADASVVAGNFERSFDVETVAVVGYENTSGAFAGAALNGGNLSNAQDSNRAYYGQELTVSDILNGKKGTASQTEGAAPFISQLPI